MEIILEFIKYALPLAVVGTTIYLVVKMFLDKEKTQKVLDIKKENKKLTMPLRLQAYERIVLFLERISPENLVMRLANPRMSAQQMQFELIKTVRSEFEHNMSQQLYVSEEAWELVKNSKEEVIRLINTSMGTLNDDAKASELSTVIIEIYSKVSGFPTKTALDRLKKEIKTLF